MHSIIQSAARLAAVGLCVVLAAQSAHSRDTAEDKAKLEQINAFTWTKSQDLFTARGLSKIFDNDAVVLSAQEYQNFRAALRKHKNQYKRFEKLIPDAATNSNSETRSKSPAAKKYREIEKKIRNDHYKAVMQGACVVFEHRDRQGRALMIRGGGMHISNLADYGFNDMVSSGEALLTKGGARTTCLKGYKHRNFKKRIKQRGDYTHKERAKDPVGMKPHHRIDSGSRPYTRFVWTRLIDKKRIKRNDTMSSVKCDCGRKPSVF